MGSSNCWPGVAESGERRWCHCRNRGRICYISESKIPYCKLGSISYNTRVTSDWSEVCLKSF